MAELPTDAATAGGSTPDVLEVPAPAHTPADAERIALEVFGIEGSARALDSERDQNFHIVGDQGDGHVLKIANRAEDAAVLDLQNRALAHIARTDPDLRIPRIRATVTGALQHPVETDCGHEMVRMVTYLHGRSLGDVPHGEALLRGLGVAVARLGRALRGFFHSAAENRLLWDIKQAAPLLEHTRDIDDPQRRVLAERLLGRFVTEVESLLPGLRAQVIHADPNADNTLVDPANEEIAGFIDFGDTVHSPLLYDLAVSLASVMLDKSDPIAAAEIVVAGYDMVTPLAEEELSILLDLVLTRLTMGVIISSWRVKQHPANRAYITAYDRPAWALLEALAGVDRQAVARRFRAACTPTPRVAPMPTSPHGDPGYDHLMERRRILLGPTLRHFYGRAVHIVRGQGAYLYDASGKRYLDAYNNVAHVGHCHPVVVAAIGRQAAVLNTNTRYLHQTILELAEQLGARLPGELSVCLFVCTGTEANDLAWQLAKSHTGHSGAIVIEGAYHGNSEAVRALSPEGPFGKSALAPHVRTLPAPDTYRGLHRGSDPELGLRYAETVDKAADSLDTAGHGLAAFIVDPVMSSSGILESPPGYLAAVQERVRAVGGLFIADEVQTGFGRSGSHFLGVRDRGPDPGHRYPGQTNGKRSSRRCRRHHPGDRRLVRPPRSLLQHLRRQSGGLRCGARRPRHPRP